jgi:hypothetical protein
MFCCSLPYFLYVHLHHSSKIISHQEVTHNTVETKGFLNQFPCSWKILIRTNNYESGSRRPKNLRILRIQNTAVLFWVADVYPAVDSVPAEENQTEQNAPPRVAEAEQSSATVHKNLFRIGDILVRIRIRGSEPLTNWSGCGSVPVPKSSVTFRMP